MPGLAIAQPQLKWIPQHQPALACLELSLSLMSLDGLSWLIATLLPSSWAPKEEGRGHSCLQPDTVGFLCLPQGLLEYWEVLPVLKATPMSYHMPYGLQVCLCFEFVTDDL